MLRFARNDENSKIPYYVIPQPLWGISIWNCRISSLRGSKAKGAISSNRRHCEERVKRTTKQSKNSRFYLKFPVIPRHDPGISSQRILEFHIEIPQRVGNSRIPRTKTNRNSRIPKTKTNRNSRIHKSRIPRCFLHL